MVGMVPRPFDMRGAVADHRRTFMGRQGRLRDVMAGAWRWMRVASSVAIAACSGIGPAPVAAPPPDVEQFLTWTIKLDAAQLAALERGDVVSKVLDTKQQLNVVVFGAVVVNTPRDRIVQQALDFSTSLRAPTRKQLGFFTTPATS